MGDTHEETLRLRLEIDDSAVGGGARSAADKAAGGAARKPRSEMTDEEKSQRAFERSEERREQRAAKAAAEALEKLKALGGAAQRAASPAYGRRFGSAEDVADLFKPGPREKRERRPKGWVSHDTGRTRFDLNPTGMAPTTPGARQTRPRGNAFSHFAGHAQQVAGMFGRGPGIVGNVLGGAGRIAGLFGGGGGAGIGAAAGAGGAAGGLGGLAGAAGAAGPIAAAVAAVAAFTSAMNAAVEHFSKFNGAVAAASMKTKMAEQAFNIKMGSALSPALTAWEGLKQKGMDLFGKLAPVINIVAKQFEVLFKVLGWLMDAFGGWLDAMKWCVAGLYTVLGGILHWANKFDPTGTLGKWGDEADKEAKRWKPKSKADEDAEAKNFGLALFKGLAAAAKSVGGGNARAVGGAIAALNPATYVGFGGKGHMPGHGHRGPGFGLIVPPPPPPFGGPHQGGPYQGGMHFYRNLTPTPAQTLLAQQQALAKKAGMTPAQWFALQRKLGGSGLILDPKNPNDPGLGQGAGGGNKFGAPGAANPPVNPPPLPSLDIKQHVNYSMEMKLHDQGAVDGAVAQIKGWLLEGMSRGRDESWLATHLMLDGGLAHML